MIAHTLGNPFDLAAVSEFAREHGLWLVEDCCDALARPSTARKWARSAISGRRAFIRRIISPWARAGCLHQRCAIEGARRILSGLGRDCYCEPGKDNTCGKRFEWQLGELPCGYDHKYTYSHIGYNLKVTDMQARLGCRNLRSCRILLRRGRGTSLICTRECALEDVFILPEATPRSEPSWFGFPIAVRATRRLRATRSYGIWRRARLELGCSLREFASSAGLQGHRVPGDRRSCQSDFVMNQVFWSGCFPADGRAQGLYAVGDSGFCADGVAGKSI